MKEAPKEFSDYKSSAPLPVLCIENGMVILRFSEIFGIQESSKRRHKKEHMYLMHKGIGLEKVLLIYYHHFLYRAEPLISYLITERIKPIDAPHLFEEDEEAFLRGSFREFSPLKYEHQVHDDIMGTLYDEMVSEKFGLEAKEQPFDSFISGTPMKDDVKVDFSTVWKLPKSPNFYPLDQQDWENSILWDEDSLDDSSEVHDISVLKTGVKEVRNEMEENFSIWGSSTFEDMEKKTDLADADLVSPGTLNHPQFLRLESRVQVDNSSYSDGMEENNVATKSSNLLLQNQQIMEGSWLDDVIWEPNVPFTRQKLILDLDDKQMLFEVLDEKNESEIWRHAGAMLITHSLESHGRDSLELLSHGNETYSRFDIANDIFYSNRKTSQQLNASSEKRIAYGVEVYHSAPALKLETIKTKLSK